MFDSAVAAAFFGALPECIEADEAKTQSTV